MHVSALADDPTCTVYCWYLYSTIAPTSIDFPGAVTGAGVQLWTDFPTFSFLPAIAGVPNVAGISAIAGIPTVAVALVTAVVGICAIAGVPTVD